MLLDVVSVYNKVTDLTDKKQAVKISIDKVQVCFASTLALCVSLLIMQKYVLLKIVLSHKCAVAGPCSYLTT